MIDIPSHLSFSLSEPMPSVRKTRFVVDLLRLYLLSLPHHTLFFLILHVCIDSFLSFRHVDISIPLCSLFMFARTDPIYTILRVPISL